MTNGEGFMSARKPRSRRLRRRIEQPEQSKRFQFSRLNIVRSVTVDPKDAALAGVIINLEKILSMKVGAECVGTKEQMEILRSLGCDQIQGHYSSRPRGASAIIWPRIMAVTVSKYLVDFLRYIGVYGDSLFRLNNEKE